MKKFLWLIFYRFFNLNFTMTPEAMNLWSFIQKWCLGKCIGPFCRDFKEFVYLNYIHQVDFTGQVLWSSNNSTSFIGSHFRNVTFQNFKYRKHRRKPMFCPKNCYFRLPHPSIYGLILNSWPHEEFESSPLVNCFWKSLWK